MSISVITPFFTGFTLNAIIGLVVLCLLLIASALISSSETAFFSLQPADIDDLESRNDAKSKLALRLREQPKTLLATILIGNNFVNVIAIAGAPFNLAIPHAWVDNYAYSTAEGGDRWNTAWKVGGMLEFNIAKNWGINLEAGTNYVRQKNEGLADNNKWWPYAMAGISYKFGFKKAKKAEPAPVVEKVVEEPAPAPVVEKKPEPKPEPKPQPKPEPKPVVKEPAKIGQNIFFALGKSDISAEQNANLDNIAKFAKENPKAKLSLVGYADKETGNAKVNKELSEKRANAVKAALVKRGVEASRISTDWKGDTVQPFANNDDNRVVIVVGEEK